MRRSTGNVPADVSSFVGRRSEIAEAKRLLATGRLVTLTGVGGVGKTRLALRVASETRRAFPDGVWVVELAALAEPSLLVQTTADVLGLHDRSTRSSLAVLRDYLADKRLMLVLDNCEHLLDACGGLVSELLRAAAGLSVLATSRQAMHVAGEQIMMVSPLPAPPVESQPWQRLSRYDAVRLFAERARAMVPGFEITADNADTVARICRHIDGLPLAIELAAGRLRELSPYQILQRLDDHFQLLTGGDRLALPRHQTLRAAIDWSYELCSPRERALWARLVVFSGTFDLDAAEVVCAGDGICREQVLDLIAGLVDKSVLAREDHSRTVRYHMVETIRQYGLQKSSSVDMPALRRRHRDYYLGLALRAEAGWFGVDQVAWSERLRLEHTNLRLALDFCLTEPDERQLCLAISAALWSYWTTCGVVSEGQYWLRRVLRNAPEATPLRAKALWVAGWVAQLRGDLPGASLALSECQTLAERLGYASASAYAVHYSARLAMALGDYPRALTLYEDALERHHALNDEAGATTLLFRLALCLCLRDDPGNGDVEYAMALCQECIRRSERSGEIWCRSYARYVYGLALWKQGKHVEADQAALDSARLMHEVRNLPGIGMALELLAWIAVVRGNPERAARLIGSAQHIWHAVGAPLSGITQLLAYQHEAERRAQAALGAVAYRKAVRQGAKLTPAQAVDYAMGRDGRSAELSTVYETGPNPLTRREQEVAGLVAQGLSDREIAGRLTIAQRTAEGHVERILAKLGLANRVQLATWVTEREQAEKATTG